MSGEHQHTNRLIRETSPYLLQHAHNPVDWYPWGEEALARARQDEKPVLLSIGYSACHWCHVMERESFENDRIAGLMNKHFVCIKVDREERPDLDEIYMAATLALNQGQGGWPMTVFLTPDQAPFFAGTYFPPSDRWGRPGFDTVLKQLAEAWESDRDRVLHSSARLTSRLRLAAEEEKHETIGQVAIDRAVDQLREQFDPRFGGFGPAPKFPPSMALSLLLRHHRRTGDEDALTMATKTLDAMAYGGMYDQIGGGFARYSTDERWLVPHFEKMLYDNALLSRVYLEAFQLTRSELYERIGRETLDYVLREMTSEEGSFYSATDADSEGVEGKFFVWTRDEIHNILDEDVAECFCDYYGIGEHGNWEGKNIPNVRRSIEYVAKDRGIEPKKLQSVLEQARQKVYEARQRRVPPGVDDKILTAWNGLMISSMAIGSRVLEDARYAEAGCQAADFLCDQLTREDGRLLRTYRRGKAYLHAYLEDYAYLCDALIDLYEATWCRAYLEHAQKLAERLLADFLDSEGGAFYSTSRDHEQLILRAKEGQDGAIPNANAVAAGALARLSFYFDRDDFRRSAEQAINAYGKLVDQAPLAFCRSLAVADFLLEGPTEFAFVGARDGADFKALRTAVDSAYVPNQIIGYRAPDDPDDPILPLLKGKELVQGKAALYICRDFSCERPISNPSEMDEGLRASRNSALTQRKTSLDSATGARAPSAEDGVL